MSFFIRSGGSKRKSSSVSSTKNTARKDLKRGPKSSFSAKSRKNGLSDLKNEEILSDSDIDSEEEIKRKPDDIESSDEDIETAQEKRLRLAKDYIAQLQNEEEERADDEDFSKDLIAHRLKQDILEQSGKLHKEIANQIEEPSISDITVLKGHKLAVTCLVIFPDDKYVFSGSKDCCIIKWDILKCKKVNTIQGGRKGTEEKHTGHTAHILCMAISTDGKYLVTGDRNKFIYVWNPLTCERIHIFKGHRDAVSGLAFRKGTHQLFSASHDRAIKIWNLDEMAYVETLFGHQDAITCIDSLSRERAVSSGGRDGSVRIWKVIEESQLLFHGHTGSIDCVSLINEEFFVSGGDDNSIAVWGVMKKKPLVVAKQAHTGNEENCDGKIIENWITSVVSLQHTDLIASAGSKDGCIRFWQCGKGFKSLSCLFKIPLVGFVNSLKFNASGSLLVAGVGQEHKLGRWWRIKEAKNSVCLIRINRNESQD